MNSANTILKRGLLCALLTFFSCLASIVYAADPEPGDGSPENPYIIDSETELRTVTSWVSRGQSADMHYRLSADIDLLPNTGWTPIGSTSKPFRGVFDGDGHVIRNLRSRATGFNDRGLFGYVADARIRNIGLINAEISGLYYIGLLVGRAERSTIEGAFAFGQVSGSNYVGGLVGSISGTNMRDCFSTAEVRGASAALIGGLVGVSRALNGTNSEIKSSYASGPAAGETKNVQTGGLLGSNARTCRVTDSYAVGSTHSGAAEINSGGLIGRAEEKSILSNAAFDPQGTGRKTPYGVDRSADTTDVLAVSTDTFTRDTLPAALSASSFAASEGSYPQLALFAGHPSETFRRASALAAVPVFFSAQSEVLSSDGVLDLPVRDAGGSDLRWELPEGRGFFVERGESDRKILLLAHGTTALTVSNGEGSGVKRFFISADVGRGVEIELAASNDAACEAVLRYNGVGLGRAALRFTASGDVEGNILTGDTATDEEGIARYELPANAPTGDYDVCAALPGTAWESNRIKVHVAAPPLPPAPPTPVTPDSREPDGADSPPKVPPIAPNSPDAPDQPGKPDEPQTPDNPGDPEPRPNIPALPQPGDGGAASEDTAPLDGLGGCGAGTAGIAPFLAIALSRKTKAGRRRTEQ